MGQLRLDELLAAIGTHESVSNRNSRTPAVDRDASSDMDNSRLLIAAVLDNHSELIRQLVEQGANLEQANSHGDRALHIAAASDCLSSIETLIELGAQIDSEAHLGITPLMKAAIHGKKWAVELLLDHGAQVDRRDAIGFDAWILALENGHTEVAGILEIAGM